MASRHPKPKNGEQVVTRAQMERFINASFALYHRRWHTPWYVRLWKRLTVKPKVAE